MNLYRKCAFHPVPFCGCYTEKGSLEEAAVKQANKESTHTSTTTEALVWLHTCDTEIPRRFSVQSWDQAIWASPGLMKLSLSLLPPLWTDCIKSQQHIKYLIINDINIHASA